MFQNSKNNRTLIAAFVTITALVLSIGLAQSAAPNARARLAKGPTLAETHEIFVFQVGIDKYTSPTVPKLNGCVQDVLDMKQLLMSKKFNVPADHFLTLTDGQATHQAIIDGFRKQLIGNANTHRNAVFIFQYSGHGSQVKDRNGDKADGLDSTFVPVNSRDLDGSNFDVVDDEIRELFDELSQYTSNIVFIIDACHSGNPTRGAGKTRGIPADARAQPEEKSKPPSTRGPQLRGADLTAMLPRDLRYVSIASTKSDELANEKTVEVANEQTKSNGALTYCLLEALQKANPETTYRQLMADVANAVTTNYPDQHPQVEGDIGRPVFGGSATREDPFIEIEGDIKDDTITIKAGSAQGIGPGTIVALYDPDALHLVGDDKKLATGTITHVTGPFTSTVKLNTTRGITSKAKVVMVSPDFGSVKTRVAFAKELSTRPRNAVDTKGQLTDLLIDKKTGKENTPSIKLVGEVNLDVPRERDNNWDVIVKQIKFSDLHLTTKELKSCPGKESAAKPQSPTRSADRAVYVIAGPDGHRPLFDFFAELDDPTGAQKIADALEHLANQRSLRAVSNRTSKLNGGIRINVLRVYGNFCINPLKIDKEEEVELSKDQQDYAFDQGEVFRFEIENQSSEDLYVTLFEISTDGSIKIWYPDKGATVRIPQGGKVKPNIILRTTDPAGYDTFKVIASTDPRGPSDFAFLEQAGVTARTEGLSIGTLPNWTTSQVNFVISNRVKN
jgi:Caspase domain/Domain of unknown function (DUF4384)